MASLWKRLFRQTPIAATSVPLPEIIRHFNDAAADEKHFPSTIDPRIYHVQLILEYFGDLTGKRVLDVGCGKGRFARVLEERFPKSRIVAFDLAEAMLRCVPAGTSPCAGSM
ncbi:MAG TPA: methyltransferase domain-containing protein, partial [Bryobacteraceae bacterium]|nr:methyltransferase domain-containing protein [Bryobacteraceae bacterium]